MMPSFFVSDRALAVRFMSSFRQITNEVLKGYTKIIKNPMNISRIQARLDAHAYRTLEEFDADVQLMTDNCIKYYEKKHLLSDYTQVSMRE